MTEAEWLACADPDTMLQFLQGRASNRKLRLFACACCRLMWDVLPDRRSRQAVEVAERYADGLATAKERRAAKKAAEQVSLARRARGACWLAWWSTEAADSPERNRHSAATSALFLRNFGHVRDSDRVCCDLLRDLFGPLLFRRVSVPRSWLSWQDRTVGRLAQGIYDDRAFDRLPVLADALEDAGCTDADILTHGRQPGEHVRGCWVVDLLLGKS